MHVHRLAPDGCNVPARAACGNKEKKASPFGFFLSETGGDFAVAALRILDTLREDPCFLDIVETARAATGCDWAGVSFVDYARGRLYISICPDATTPAHGADTMEIVFENRPPMLFFCVVCVEASDGARCALGRCGGTTWPKLAGGRLAAGGSWQHRQPRFSKHVLSFWTPQGMNSACAARVEMRK